MPPSDVDRNELLNLIALDDELRAHRRRRPSDWYAPHATPPVREGTQHQSCRLGRTSGQLQGHQSRHIIRVAAPGNGWGGTTWMGCEVDAWVTHSGRWQQTPEWPIIAIWGCPSYKQFAIVRRNLEQFCLTRPYRFVESGMHGPHYRWPDGSCLFLASYDSDWERFQGIELDLVCFDEIPPLPLWREMMQRRRGRRKARYICKATQTSGLSWMAAEIYEPWLEFHRRLGLDEDEAMDEQLHPEIWCWPKGGIHDNPGADVEDVRWYESRPWSSPKERKVRLFGGFESWVGDPVFDLEAVDAMRARAAAWRREHAPRSGTFRVELP